MRAEHPRVSDLALRVVTPGGAGALVFENRGLSSSAGLGGVLVTSNYHHVALTIDRGEGLAKIYFNGEVVAQQAARFSASNTPSSFHLGSMAVAQLPASPIHFDDVGLWRRTLRDGEIRRIYEDGLVGKPKSPSLTRSGLAALWPSTDRVSTPFLARPSICSTSVPPSRAR